MKTTQQTARAFILTESPDEQPITKQRKQAQDTMRAIEANYKLSRAVRAAIYYLLATNVLDVSEQPETITAVCAHIREYAQLCNEVAR